LPSVVGRRSSVLVYAHDESGEGAARAWSARKRELENGGSIRRSACPRTNNHEEMSTSPADPEAADDVVVDGGEMAAYGALSVQHASAVEQRIQASMEDVGVPTTTTTTTPSGAGGGREGGEDVQARLLGLEREIWALRTSEEEAGVVGDGLQQAVRRERLGTLERSWNGVVAGLGAAARAKAKQRMEGMVAGGEMKKGQEKEKGQGKGAGAGQKPPAQGRDLLQGGKGKRQGKSRGSSSGPTGLMEVDLFEDVRPKNARGGAGGAVRLLVCLTPDA